MEKILIPKVKLSVAMDWANGNQSCLARRLGVSREAISKMVRKNRTYLPEKRALQIAYSYPELVEKD